MGFGESGTANLQGSQHDVVRDLRQKTHQVEELSMKMDELLQLNSTLESQINKVHRFNPQMFSSLQTQFAQGSITEQTLRAQICELNG